MAGVVGCDISSKAAYIAELHHNQAPIVRTVPVGDVAETFDQLCQIMNNASERGACCVYIEQVFGRYNFMSAIGLKRVATMLEVSGASVGLKIRWAHPSVWRKAIYGKGTHVDTKARKKQALSYVNERWPEKALTDHNEAEACLIALYGSIREG